MKILRDRRDRQGNDDPVDRSDHGDRPHVRHQHGHPRDVGYVEGSRDPGR